MRNNNYAPGRGPPSPPQDEVNVTKQLKDFWAKVGLFSRLCFVINVAVYLYQLTTRADLKDSAICFGPIYDARQFYRLLSSEFTHANPAHIMFNMSGLLVFGVDVENMYGTAYYMAINFALIVVSSILSLGFYALMAFCVPVIYRGGP
jgi:membrane associated rhomboid family serine protease